MAFLQTHLPFVTIWTEIKAHYDRLSDLPGEHALGVALRVGCWKADGVEQVNDHSQFSMLVCVRAHGCVRVCSVVKARVCV